MRDDQGQRPSFTSSTGTILTMIGVAVGLGNVWRFPYMMGRYGGSAFLFTYLAFVVIFAIPAIMGEWALGRHTQRGPLGAFHASMGKGPGLVVAFMLLLTVTVADSYYMLVIGYLGYTTWISGTVGFSTTEALETHAAGLGNGWLQYGMSLLVLLGVLAVLRLGLVKGIQRASTVFMPFFGGITLVLIAYTLTMDGVTPHLQSLIQPDFTLMKDPQNLFAAMGQAIYSVGLGGTFFVIYGSYMRAQEPLVKTAIFTGFGDAGAALMATLFIIPAVGVFGLEASQGPTLIFETLPRLFGAMPMGRLLGTLFLIGLMLVAFLSAVAALQVVIGGLGDHLGMSQRKALLLMGAIEVVLILPSALNPDLIGVLDMIFGSGMQCLGCGLAMIALTWCLGKSTTCRQILGREDGFGASLLFFWLRWVIPLALLCCLAVFIYDSL